MNKKYKNDYERKKKFLSPFIFNSLWKIYINNMCIIWNNDMLYKGTYIVMYT